MCKHIDEAKFCFFPRKPPAVDLLVKTGEDCASKSFEGRRFVMSAAGGIVLEEVERISFTADKLEAVGFEGGDFARCRRRVAGGVQDRLFEGVNLTIEADLGPRGVCCRGGGKCVVVFLIAPELANGRNPIGNRLVGVEKDTARPDRFGQAAARRRDHGDTGDLGFRRDAAIGFFPHARR